MKAQKRVLVHRHDDARRAPVAARDAHAHATTSPRIARGLCARPAATCSRSNAGAARPSTSPCASSTRTRGSGWRAVRERRAQHPDADAAARRQRRRLHQLSRQCGEVLRRARRRRAASTCSASSTASTGSRTCASRSTRWSRPARSPKARSATPATSSIRTAPNTTSNIMSALAKELEAAGAHILGLKDMAGLLKPAAAQRADRDAEAGDRPADPPPHPRHLGHRRRRRSWRRSRPASMRSMRRWTRCRAPPPSPASARSSRRCAHTERDTGLDPEAIRQISLLLGGGAHAVRAPSRATSRPAPRRSICTKCRAGSSPTSRSRRARSGSRRAGTRSPRPMRDVNEMFGDIVKVTPSSKVVGDMALMMVAQGLTRADVEDPARDIAFPDSVVEMLHGDLGQPPGGWPEGAAEEGAEGRGRRSPSGRARCLPGRRSRGRARRGREGDRPRRSTTTSSPPT